MFEPGNFIADRYEILDKVGAGGMSDVYRAHDHILDRVVAIKVLKAEFAEDMTFVNKFRTEAQSAAGLEHPNIVNIYDVGSENGMYYIVMEYIEGITLKTYIEKKGQLNFKEAVSIAIQVGRGIEAAHSKSIIHRDIKPQNVIISVEGKVKVTDFGIARATSSNTVHSDVMGSVHYSSPEQARNGFIDGRSDIYSLGIVMYEMVTGRVPFNGDNTVAIAIQHLQSEITPPSAYATDLPVSMEKIILKATQKIADQRYNTITELLTDLKRALVTPNEDFVVMAEPDLSKTRVMTADEKEALAVATAGVSIVSAGVGNTSSESGATRKVKTIKAEANTRPSRRKDPFEDDDYDEDDDDEDGDTTDKLFVILGIAAAFIIVAIILVIVANILGIINLGSSTPKPTMPNVVGEKVTEVTPTLTAAGLLEDNIKVSFVEVDPTAGYTNGQIIEQSVEAGDKVSKKTTLILSVAKFDEKLAQSQTETTVNANAKDVQVPAVVGQTEENAAKALESQGFTVKRSYENSASVASGNVISQSPASGETAKEGSSVVLVISSGNVSVKVPNVVGKSQQEAVDAMNAAGLNVTSVKTQNSTKVAAGIVMEQSVEADKEVSADTKISLVISAGKSAKYYSISESVKNDSTETYMVYFYDANGKELYKEELPSGKSRTYNLSNIATATGKLKVLKQSDNSVVTEKELTLTVQ